MILLSFFLLSLFTILSLVLYLRLASLFLAILLLPILYWVWFARNRATFRNSALNSSKITGLIKNDVRMRIFGDRPDRRQEFLVV